MNLEMFKRNISLYKLGIAELRGKEKRIYEFLLRNLSGLNAYSSHTANDYYFFGKSIHKISLYYRPRTGHLWFNYDTQSFFKREMNMKCNNIDSLMIWWFRTTLNLNPISIDVASNTFFNRVGAELDLKLIK